MRRSFLLLMLMTMLGLALVQPACTDTDVFESPGLGTKELDNKLTVKGEFCTESPDELSYPVKIMFIVDCSQSMNVTDPPPAPNRWSGRVQAVWDVIAKYRYDPGVSFAIIRFDSTADVETQVDTNGDGIADQVGFINDLAPLLKAVNALQPASGNTSYQSAIGLAETTLAMDMTISSSGDRKRTKYVVIFISDGLPYPVDYINQVNTPDSIESALKDMMNLPETFGVAAFTFNTALLSTDMPADVLQQAEQLLKDMAQIGGGTFRNFSNGEEINFLNVDYTSVKRTYSIKDNSFMAYNMNASQTWTPLSDGVDTDGDGLVDSLERTLGTAVGNPDTDGDGFSDFLEYRLRQSGFDPLNPNDADCKSALDRLDSDGDGLRDCEERMLGTDPQLFDTDGDGISDFIEVRGGTNPLVNDTELDMDFDGSSNGREIAWHTNPTVPDAEWFSKYAYRYQLSRLPGVFQGRMCYNFQVDNITLMPTETMVGSTQRGYNNIMVYVGQAPLDNTTDQGIFRVACARARYIQGSPGPDIKVPPSGVVTFEQKDFKRPAGTSCQSDADCPYQECDPSNYTCVDLLGNACDSKTPCPNYSCVKTINAGQGTCSYPVAAACLSDSDCPFFSVDPATNLCTDASHSIPVNGQCPQRECIPPYAACSPTNACPPNQVSARMTPDCLVGSCRVPCQNPSDCNPGETCEPDSTENWIPCTPATAATVCPAGFVCQNQSCRQPCAVASDCTSSWTESCDSAFCVAHHCLSHLGGSCQGVACTADTDCPLQPCDAAVGRCRTQPCMSSLDCSHQHCEPVLGFCMGPACTGNTDCRGDRGFTCNSVVGKPCSLDIDCPVDFCSLVVHTCTFLQNGQKVACASNTDCPVNACISENDPQNPEAMYCSSTNPPASCTTADDCFPNICQVSYACSNSPATACTNSLECPQTFCKTPDNTCINDSTKTCNPATENNDNNCNVGMCSRTTGLGACDTAAAEACQSDQDCPFYQCNASVGTCNYPVEVACTSTDASPCQKLGAGWECNIPSGTAGTCIKPCGSDSDCPHSRCQGRCIPMNSTDQKRCTDCV